MTRYVFLNALPLNALGITKPTRIIVTPVKIDTLRQLAPLMRESGSVECYIRHPATVNLLNKLLGLNLQPSNGLYSYQLGDVLYVVTLKKPIRGQEINDITENDIDIYQIEVIQ